MVFLLQFCKVGSLIDPGVNGYKMLRAIETCQTNISKIFLTHAHKSHIACIGDIIESFGDIPIYLHEKDRALFESNSSKEVLNSNDVPFYNLLYCSLIYNSSKTMMKLKLQVIRFVLLLSM